MVAHAYSPSYWEVEIRNFAIWGQPGQKVNETFTSVRKKLDVVVHSYDPRYAGGHK
jgi:hypothetical protein